MAKDIEDIISIVNNGQVNWDTVIDESKEQVRFGNETAILRLGEKLERLSNQKAITVSKDILNKLWKLLKNQIKDKPKNKNGGNKG